MKLLFPYMPMTVHVILQTHKAVLKH